MFNIQFITGMEWDKERESESKKATVVRWEQKMIQEI